MNSRVLSDAPDEPRLDRLPWLESADPDIYQRPSALRVIALVLLGLGLIAAAIMAYDSYQDGRRATGTGGLIAAQEGDYKVKPDQPGGMKVDGEGDTVFATSEGGASNGTVDASKVPEVPVAGKAAAGVGAAGPGTRTVVTAIPARDGTRLAAATPATAAPRSAAESGGGSLVQLGSFPSEAAANGAWTNASKRFAYLASLGKSVEKAEVAGNTVYRLRVNAGSAGNATSICGRLKVAGEACFIPR
jgi:hypothetical protein